MVAATWPWTDLQLHAHWGSVELTPFAKGLRLADRTLMAFLFFVLGAAFGSGGTTARRLQRALAWGFVCALVSESTQVFTHTHLASAFDVALSTLAAWLGAYAAVQRHRAWLASEGDDPFAV